MPCMDRQRTEADNYEGCAAFCCRQFVPKWFKGKCRGMPFNETVEKQRVTDLHARPVDRQLEAGQEESPEYPSEFPVEGTFEPGESLVLDAVAVPPDDRA